jgi:hypothetical protein
MTGSTNAAHAQAVSLAVLLSTIVCDAGGLWPHARLCQTAIPVTADRCKLDNVLL